MLLGLRTAAAFLCGCCHCAPLFSVPAAMYCSWIPSPTSVVCQIGHAWNMPWVWVVLLGACACRCWVFSAGCVPLPTSPSSPPPPTYHLPGLGSLLLAPRGNTPGHFSGSAARICGGWNSGFLTCCRCLVHVAVLHSPWIWVAVAVACWRQTPFSAPTLLFKLCFHACAWLRFHFYYVTRSYTTTTFGWRSFTIPFLLWVDSRCCCACPPQFLPSPAAPRARHPASAPPACNLPPHLHSPLVQHGRGSGLDGHRGHAATGCGFARRFSWHGIWRCRRRGWRAGGSSAKA